MVIPGRQATINTYVWDMHSEGFHVFVIRLKQWEVQEEDVGKKRKKKKT